jgi:hypothetical protein
MEYVHEVNKNEMLIKYMCQQSIQEKQLIWGP